jgi:ABC-2 type transport system ATP-binding protein
MIVLNDLSKRFDHRFVVDGLNLKIKPGEIVGLLGPNGAGKTTTLRMLAGVLPPSRGSVLINNQNLKEFGKDIKKIIGFLPENNPLYDDLTVEEYLNFWAEIKGLVSSQKEEALDFVIKNCGIGEVFYRLIGELSKGYRQRVGLAQAILARPEILILDEPTEGLDPNQRQEIAKLIRNLGNKRTVIISSHVLGEISRISTRLVIIHQGKIVADETPEDLKKLGGKTVLIEVEVEGKGVKKVLENIPGVLKVEQEEENHFLLETERGKDIREDVFKTAVSKHWILKNLTLKEKDIEEVFRILTEG